MKRLFRSPSASTFQGTVEKQNVGRRKEAPASAADSNEGSSCKTQERRVFVSEPAPVSRAIVISTKCQMLFAHCSSRTSWLESSSSPASPPRPLTLFLAPPRPPPKRSASESAPGAQVVGLYEAADDATNDVGWRGDEDGDSFRIAAVVTGSHFAEEAGFNASVRSVHWKNHSPIRVLHPPLPPRPPPLLTHDVP